MGIKKIFVGFQMNGEWIYTNFSHLHCAKLIFFLFFPAYILWSKHIIPWFKNLQYLLMAYRIKYKCLILL